MKELQQASVVLALAESLRRSGSWTGETHIQKTAYFLQELLRVPSGFHFILYKHGPYSFDLSDTLTMMRANGYVELEPRYPYGPSVKPSPSSKILQRLFKMTLRKFEPHVEFVVGRLSAKGVKDLERLATALYVTKDPAVPPEQRAKRITELKPHVPFSDALASVAELDGMIHDAHAASLIAA
jgi:uncharacterized protein YwgA